jgi:uncharacterized protein (DUF58 family)
VTLPLPTALGWKAAAFFFLLVGAFLATPYSNLFFLLISFLTILGFLGWLWTVTNFRGLRAELGEVAPAPAGTPLVVPVRISGRSRACFAVSLELEIRGSGRLSIPLGIVTRASWVQARLPPLPRGLHDVAAAHVVSIWPLGLFRARRPVKLPGVLVVYPAPAGMQESRERADGLAELSASLSAKAGLLQPSSFREYQIGDEFRMVHWKASARRGLFVIKEWDGGEGNGHEILLDRRCSAGKLEKALSLLSAVAQSAKESKELLTLHSQDLSATYGSGHRPWREVLTFLAGASVVSQGGPPPPPVSPTIPRLPLGNGAAS